MRSFPSPAGGLCATWRLFGIEETKNRVHTLALLHGGQGMERDLWKTIVAALKALPPWSPRNALFSNKQILAIHLWAAINHRPISWACQRKNWPPQAWRRKIPDQSTMSRRMKDPRLIDDLDRIIHRIQRHVPEGRVLLVDGKAYPLEDRTNDKEATNGHASGRYAKGYKLHVIVDEYHRIVQWAVRPMNCSEITVGKQLVEHMNIHDRTRLVIADAGYNSNSLFSVMARHGLRLIAPRCKPGTGLGWRQHHRDRLASKRLTEDRGGWMWPMMRALRTGIERFFAGLTSSDVGAEHIPPWVRGVRRTTLWLGAKLVINAARITRLHAIHA